jgi:DNA repair exonuclease SbcCD nuclease subunit
MIYITGDVHIPIDIKKLSTKRFEEQKHLSKSDYLIILGDFGGVWDNGREELYWRRWLDEKSFTTLFIDGNHENFQLLSNYKTEDFCGGKVQRISESIFRLMRGQVFEIEGYSFFTFGGAESHDKAFRKEGVSWWREELPSEAEIEESWRNLERCNFKVDYILTHCASRSVQNIMNPDYGQNCLTDFLEQVKDKVNYKKWFFGHYHVDREVDEKHVAFFEKTERIDNI